MVDEERYKWYLERVAERRGRAERLSESMDVAIITLSSGALALSSSFFGENSSLTSPFILIISWICFLLSIGSIIVSMDFAARSGQIEKKILDEWFEKGALDTPNLVNKWGKRTQRSHYISLVLLLGGFTSLIFFASVNIMNDSQSLNKLNLTEKTLPPLSDPLPPPNATVDTQRAN